MVYKVENPYDLDMVMAKPNFVNRTLWTGDNLDILRGMNSETVDLIYLDPPFNSNKNYEAPVGSKAAGAAFKDTWTLSDLDVAWMGLIADEHPAIAYILDASGRAHGKGMQSYLTMMAVRLLEMRRVLKDTGSIYLHCDPYASHYLKMLMDSAFVRGGGLYRRELVWSNEDSSGFKSQAMNWIRGHDTILFYTKSDKDVFNKQYRPLAESTIRRYDKRDKDGNAYKIYYDKAGVAREVYLNEARGRAMSDVWADIPSFQTVNNTGELTGYPTQKPLALLERIIKASSNESDLVLDPFCGCATACVAAERLSRQWIGIDLSPKAVELVQHRLKQEEPGIALWANRIVHRTDIPKRTDIEVPKHYRQNAHVLYGEQEGNCAGCKEHFPFKLFDVDHVIPQSKGGTDHIDNLQLLCTHCNRLKGDSSQEHFIVKLKEYANATS